MTAVAAPKQVILEQRGWFVFFLSLLFLCFGDRFSSWVKCNWTDWWMFAIGKWFSMLRELVQRSFHLMLANMAQISNSKRSATNLLFQHISELSYLLKSFTISRGMSLAMVLFLLQMAETQSSFILITVLGLHQVPSRIWIVFAKIQQEIGRKKTASVLYDCGFHISLIPVELQLLFLLNVMERAALKEFIYSQPTDDRQWMDEVRIR